MEWTAPRSNTALDECYIFGDPSATRPHFAGAVVWTRGGIEKLEVYRKRGVRQVGYWRKGVLRSYALRGEQYEPILASEVFPGIDLAQLASFLARPTTDDAIRNYREARRGGN